MAHLTIVALHPGPKLGQEVAVGRLALQPEHSMKHVLMSAARMSPEVFAQEAGPPIGSLGVLACLGVQVPVMPGYKV